MWKPYENVRVLVTIQMWSITVPQDLRGGKGTSEMEITVRGVMHSTAVLQHRASLDQPALQCLLSFSPQCLLNCSFLFYTLPPPPPCFQAMFFFPPSFLLLLRRCALVASRRRLLLLGPLRVCSKSRQPLTAFAPDFIRNSGPYSRCFPPSVRNSIHQSGVVAPWGGRLNPVLLESTMLEVSRACICEDIWKTH